MMLVIVVEVVAKRWLSHHVSLDHVQDKFQEYSWCIIWKDQWYR